MHRPAAFRAGPRNTDSASVEYHPWDQTSGTRETRTDSTADGGATAFSTLTETAAITVTAVNDVPALDTSGNPTLTTISEDETDNAGELVSSLVRGSISIANAGEPPTHGFSAPHLAHKSLF